MVNNKLLRINERLFTLKTSILKKLYMRYESEGGGEGRTEMPWHCIGPAPSHPSWLLPFMELYITNINKFDMSTVPILMIFKYSEVFPKYETYNMLVL